MKPRSLARPPLDSTAKLADVAKLGETFLDPAASDEKAPTSPQKPPAKAKPRPRPAKPPERPKYPWDEIVAETLAAGRTPQTNVRLPIELHAELKWFSETTYGKTLADIIIEALRPKLDQMRKERGIK